MDWWGTNLWENAINPVATSTITTCYPSQLYSSVMVGPLDPPSHPSCSLQASADAKDEQGAINSVALPAFNPLVCPLGWNAAMYNATYGVCCPAGFNVLAPNYNSLPSRPFSGAGCVSILGAYQSYAVTSYDTTALLTTVSTAAPSTGTFVHANAFDGIVTGLPTSTAAPSTTSSTTSTSTSSIATSCATPAANVSVTFQIQYPVNQNGETINLYGSTPALGSWVVSASLLMSDAFYTTLYPIWEVTVALAAGTAVQYKYIHFLPDGTYNTTSGANFTLTVSEGCSTTQTVVDTWR